MSATSRGVVLLLALCVLAAGCAAAPEEAGGPLDGIDPASDEPLLQVVVAGGFVPAGTDFVYGAELTVYADGRAITHGPQDMMYPPPALSNLRAVALDRAGVESILQRAEDAGLLGDIPEYGEPAITDTPTTEVTLRAGLETFTHAANALGVGVDSPEDGDYGLTAQQQEARERLAGFLDDARQIIDAAGDAGPYATESYAVQARPVPIEEPPVAESPDLEPVTLPWPLPEVDLAAAADCVLVSGSAAQTLTTSLGEARALTRFEQNGVPYEVWARALLPNENDCTDVL